MKWLVGVDEAGRGPLAGPVAVGVAAVPMDFDWELLPGVRDSKKMKPADRERIFKLAQMLTKEGKLSLAVTQISASIIDQKGIVPAVTKALQTSLKKIALDPADCRVLLDGGLKAPTTYLDQTTIIKGDDKELVIGLASIMAKVTRDRYMMRISQETRFAPYGFDVHKGYGTKVHRELIKKHGLSDIHRVSFCRGLLLKE